MAAAGIDLERAEFSAEFGRALEYYTGFVFEVVSAKLGRASPVAGGGRYDDLMQAAGAPSPVPAVGAAIHTQRFARRSQRRRRMNGNTDKLILAVPSKGRLMEQTAEFFAASDLVVRKTGNERGYRGEVVGFDGIEVAYVSASEIAWHLKTGRAHIGITGEDLIREQMSDADDRVEFLKKLGFGRADVVVAVPNCWIDVRTMADLDEIALAVPPRAWALVSGRDEVHEPDAPPLRP